MKSFIHTFSMKTYISEEARVQLEEAYKEPSFWLSEENCLLIHRYNKNGVIIKISTNSEPERKYDKPHRKYNAEIIVNLYKSLNPGAEYGMVTEMNDMDRAVNSLNKTFSHIQMMSGVDLLRELKLTRVDVAKDALTPNEAYTGEVIRLSKIAMWKVYYNKYVPSGKKKNWNIANSSMFFNHYIKAKIYNKKQDLCDRGYDTLSDNSGLVRFEVSLKRKLLIQLKYIKADFISLNELSHVLYKISCDGENILKKYFKEVLISGSMVSKKIQNAYIETKNTGKLKRIEKMKKYRNAVNKKQVYDFTTNKAYRIKKKFDELEISPIYTNPDFPFIPSFSDILDGKINREILQYAFYKTKDKNQIFWK